MKQIFINRSNVVNGYLTILRTKDEHNKVSVEGVLKTHKYIEEIKELETERYKLSEVDVYQEGFGSDDFFILYKFTAKNLTIKSGESPYTESEIKKREKELEVKE